MKKLILGIIAVFLIEIGFITYLQMNNSAGPTVASVNGDIAAPDRDPSVLYEPSDATPPVPALSSDQGFEPQRSRSKAAKKVTSARRVAPQFRPRAVPNNALSARAVPHRPRVRVAPRLGFHTEVQREYFGSMVVEVTYRVYDFKPSNNKRSKKGQYIA